MMKKSKRLIFESLIGSHSNDLFSVMNNQNIFKYVDESPYTNKDKLFERYDYLSRGAPPNSNEEWLTKVRRWPPIPTKDLMNFIDLQ